MRKLALAMVQAQSPPPQLFKTGLKMPHMLLWYFAKEYYIIIVAPSKGHTREDLIPHSLNLSMRILEAKWKKLPMVKLILPIMINSPKCGLHSISCKL
jgi:hypothetical protein